MTSPLGIWIVRTEAEKLGRKLEAGLGGKLCGVQINRSNREAFNDHFTHYGQWILDHDHRHRRALLARLTERQSERSRRCRAR